MTVVRRTTVRARFGAGRAAAAEDLAIDERIPTTVHREHEVPFLTRAALEHHAADRVAAGTDLLGITVGGVLEVDQPPFALEVRRLALFGSEPKVVREVLDDFARVGRFDLGLVERDHPANRFLPAFGGGAPERDARHPAFVVGLVTIAAHGLHFRVCDRDAFVGRGARRRRCGGGLRRCGRSLRHSGGYRTAEDQDTKCREQQTLHRGVQFLTLSAPEALGAAKATPYVCLSTP